MALKKLNQDFIEQKDPNLRYLGIQILEQILNDSKIKSIFSARIFEKFKIEKEYSIQSKLISIMQMIIDVNNYQPIFLSLFSKF